MRLNRSGERGVSAVVGTIIVVALATILAAIVGGYVFQVQEGTPQEPAPQVNWEYDYDRTSDTLTIRHEVGDSLDPSKLYVRYEATDTEVGWNDTSPGWAVSSSAGGGDVSADDSFSVAFASRADAEDGITIYWRNPDTEPNEVETAVLGRWEPGG